MADFKRICRELTPPLVWRGVAALHSSLFDRSLHIENRFKGKVFCIGFGKTGTTSCAAALRHFGYKLGAQAVAEMFLPDWGEGDFRRILAYCKTAEAFQDMPFSLPGTYQALDGAYPGSKFVLTIRDSSDQWFASMVRFHSKVFGRNGNIPTADDLASALYRYEGFCLDGAKLIWGYPEVALYDRDSYIARYEKHNREVMEYFQGRHDDFLVLNVADKNAYRKLADFLHIEVPADAKFPHLNSSR